MRLDGSPVGPTPVLEPEGRPTADGLSIERSSPGPSIANLAGAWPCLLSWTSGEPNAVGIELMRRAAREWDRRCTLSPLDRHTQLLLMADGSLQVPRRDYVCRAISAVVAAVRVEQPDAKIHAILGDRIDSPEELEVVVSRLRRVRPGAASRSAAAADRTPRRSLPSLLETLDPCGAAAFVDTQLGPLRTYDHDNGTNLQRVLELALDHPTRGTAARAAFMHRNTFRRQLKKAVELTEIDLDSPEERFALHLALKLCASRSDRPPLRSVSEGTAKPRRHG